MRQYVKKGVFDTFSHLNLALKRIDEQSLLDTPWVSADVRALVLNSAEHLAAATTAQDVCASKLKRARTRFHEDGARLTQLVRDFYVVLTRTGNRLGIGETLRKVFGQPFPMPRGLRIQDWQTLAHKIVAAEAEAKAMNLPDPVNPTVADLAAALDLSLASGDAFYQAQVAYKVCKLNLNAHRDEGQRVLAMVAGRLRESLRKLPKGMRRDMMRTFGFRFTSDVETQPNGYADPMPAPPTTNGAPP